MAYLPSWGVRQFGLTVIYRLGVCEAVWPIYCLRAYEAVWPIYRPGCVKQFGLTVIYSLGV